MGTGAVRILHLEDQDAVRRAIGRVLRRHLPGAEILEARTGDEALVLLHGHSVDLIITDINHPGMGGVEFIRRVRARPDTRHTPVVVMTGEPMIGTASLAIAAGARTVLRKPVMPETIVATVDRALGIKHEAEQSDEADDANLDALLVDVGAEMATLDYKVTITLNTPRDRAAFAKDVLAMANVGGGDIVVGVADTGGRFEKVGVPEDLLQHYDASRFNNAIRDFVGQALAVRVRSVFHGGKWFVRLRVPSSGSTVAMARRENAEAGLYLGRIYVRTDAARSEEARDGDVVSRLIDRIVSEVIDALHRGQ